MTKFFYIHIELSSALCLSADPGHAAVVVLLLRLSETLSRIKFGQSLA